MRKRFTWNISIHSLRMEGDIDINQIDEMLFCNFNPLPPHGGRHGYASEPPAATEFQSTPSAWRETIKEISSLGDNSDFNPLPPHGGRLNGATVKIIDADISIHSLRMEGDHLF